MGHRHLITSRILPAKAGSHNWVSGIASIVRQRDGDAQPCQALFDTLYLVSPARRSSVIRTALVSSALVTTLLAHSGGPMQAMSQATARPQRQEIRPLSAARRGALRPGSTRSGPSRLHMNPRRHQGRRALEEKALRAAGLVTPGAEQRTAGTSPWAWCLICKTICRGGVRDNGAASRRRSTLGEQFHHSPFHLRRACRRAPGIPRCDPAAFCL